jgi:hypothetical protein
MTALARLLFPVPDVRRSTTTLFVWWERRRPTYNVTSVTVPPTMTL